MAYISINDNFYRCNTCGPLGLQLALQYNPSTGDYRLIEKNITGYGPAIFYQNGIYYSDSIRDSNLFTSQDPNRLTSAGKTLSNNIRNSVFNTYSRLGGLNKGNRINDTVKPENQTASPAVTNATPGTNPGLAGAIPGLSNPPGQGNILDPGLPQLKNPIVSTPNPAFAKTLKYPENLNIDLQDTLHITQFKYEPPNKDVFSGDVTKILREGISRGAVATKKNLLGQVILPIPNNIQDSNNVSWGEDNMNAFTTAATAQIIQKPVEALGGLAAGKGASALLDALGKSGLASLAGSAPPAVLRMLLLSQGMDNPATKAALFSYILSKYQFEVSPETILSRGLGVVPNSNLQLLFNNVKLRNFTFSYMMSPRSEAEAKDVNMILRFFKQGMAAKKQTKTAGGPSLVLGTPNVFKLEYKTGNTPIKGLNKFKICALAGFGVNYAPSGQWAAYEGGQPTSVVMTMSFNELEPVYETDYTDDISSGFEYDLPKVGSEDIGY
jgi:hypothetical protein